MKPFPTRRNRHQESLLRLATKIYSWRGATGSISVGPDNAIIVVCGSDTRNTTPALPHGDLLLHAVVIAGNHDLLLDPVVGKRFDASLTELDWGSIIYLQYRSVTLTFPNGRVLTVYGAPWTPKFGNWALQHPAKSDVWTNTIPAHVDILLTHWPPLCHLDMDTYRARPRVVVFGHIHESYGQEIQAFDGAQKVWEELLLAKGRWLALCRLA